MVRFTGLQTLLAVALDYHMEVHSMDVKNAFLNATLGHFIHMDQPESFLETVYPA